MTAETSRVMGPVDYLIVRFPGNKFSGEGIAEIADLVQKGIIRVIDLVLVVRDERGELTIVEAKDLEGPMGAAYRELARHTDEWFSEADIEVFAEGLAKNSSAATPALRERLGHPVQGSVEERGCRADRHGQDRAGDDREGREEDQGRAGGLKMARGRMLMLAAGQQDGTETGAAADGTGGSAQAAGSAGGDGPAAGRTGGSAGTGRRHRADRETLRAAPSGALTDEEFAAAKAKLLG